MSYSSAYAPAQSTVPPPSAPGISGVLPGQQAVNTTRILSLTGFSKNLKTRDIQAIFVEYEDDRGGYRIKWLDDTGCLVVFNDPLTAKRAFLQLTANPHPHLMPVISNDPETPSTFPKLIPYVGEDVGVVVASVANRPRSRSIAQNSTVGGQSTSGHGASPSVGGASAHHRRMSNSSGGNFANNRSLGRASMSQYQMQAIMDEQAAPSTPPKATKANGTTASSGEGTPPSPTKEGATPNGGAIDWVAYQQQASASRSRAGSNSSATQNPNVPAFSPPTSPERTLGGLAQRAGATSPSNLRRMVSANRS